MENCASMTQMRKVFQLQFCVEVSYSPSPYYAVSIQSNYAQTIEAKIWRGATRFNLGVCYLQIN